MFCSVSADSVYMLTHVETNQMQLLMLKTFQYYFNEEHIIIILMNNIYFVMYYSAILMLFFLSPPLCVFNHLMTCYWDIAFIICIALWYIVNKE